jgi:hypothetical protein
MVWERRLQAPHGATRGLAGASDDDLADVLTTLIRGERFDDGGLARAFDEGLILRIVMRAECLLAAVPSFDG